jgi:MEMO1 family protein
VAAAAFATLRRARRRLTRVVLVGPAHSATFHGIAIPTVEVFQTPLGPVAVDQQSLAQIADLPFVRSHDVAHAPEHALEVALPFLKVILPNSTIIPSLVSDATALDVAAVIE